MTLDELLKAVEDGKTTVDHAAVIRFIWEGLEADKAFWLRDRLGHFACPPGTKGRTAVIIRRNYKGWHVNLCIDPGTHSAMAYGLRSFRSPRRALAHVDRLRCDGYTINEPSAYVDLAQAAGEA